MSTAVKVTDVSKIYRLGEIGTGTINRDLERWFKTKILGKEDPFIKIGETNISNKKGGSDVVYSLRDINFEVEQGDTVGIIGKNGAGKSTLLKLLSRVTSPTTGKIEIKGRVASLLEVGTGFHPELTGRENVFLNGAILGMRKSEIKQKFDEIVDFSGVERYIDTPVKRYSSGMYVRLAFAVAAHLESEILIVDEVLAVGDAEFQKKCLGKMGDISRGEGRTILFVSHNMAAIENLCSRGILISNGIITALSDTKTTISQYLSINNTLLNDNDISKISERKGTGTFRFIRVSLVDENIGEEVSEIQTGSNIILRLYFQTKENNLKNILIGVGINDIYDQRICFLSNELINEKIEIVSSGQKYIEFLIRNLPIAVGSYNLTLYCSSNGITCDWIQNAFHFNIINGDFYQTGKEVKSGTGKFLLDFKLRN